MRCKFCHKELLPKGVKPVDKKQPVVYKMVKTRNGVEFWDRDCWRLRQRMKAQGDLKVL